jgi:single-strand DNA-binding protein
VNKWVGIGRLTRNADVRYTNKQDGTQMCVARFTLAVDRRFKQEGQPSADFISCVAFGKQGEFIEKYLKQGSKIAVSGRIQTGSYTNKDGNKVYTTDVVIDEVEFAESKNTNNEPPASNGFIEEIDENSLPFKTNVV